MAIGALEAQAQLAAVKTNVLLWGNLTPNLSLELVTGRENQPGRYIVLRTVKESSNDTAAGAQAEFRFWISDRPMARSFVGLNMTGMRYLVTYKGNLHHGDALGPGVVYGYALPLTRHFNLKVPPE